MGDSLAITQTLRFTQRYRYLEPPAYTVDCGSRTADRIIGSASYLGYWVLVLARRARLHDNTPEGAILVLTIVCHSASFCLEPYLLLGGCFLMHGALRSVPLTWSLNYSQHTLLLHNFVLHHRPETPKFVSAS